MDVSWTEPKHTPSIFSCFPRTKQPSLHHITGASRFTASCGHYDQRGPLECTDADNGLFPLRYAALVIIRQKYAPVTELRLVRFSEWANCPVIHERSGAPSSMYHQSRCWFATPPHPHRRRLFTALLSASYDGAGHPLIGRLARGVDSISYGNEGLGWGSV